MRQKIGSDRRESKDECRPKDQLGDDLGFVMIDKTTLPKSGEPNRLAGEVSERAIQLIAFRCNLIWYVIQNIPK